MPNAEKMNIFPTDYNTLPKSKPYGYIYIAKCFEHDGLYKIGKTQSPYKRIQGLLHPCCKIGKLFIYFYVRNPHQTERMIHESFMKYVDSQHGGTREWYDFTESELQMVITLISEISMGSSGLL